MRSATITPMPLFRYFRFRLRTLLVLAVPLCAALAAAGYLLDNEGRENRRILKTLEEPATISFIEADIVEVLVSFKEKHHIEIQLSSGAAPEGWGESFTGDFQNVKLRTALDELLGPKGLGYIITSGVLLVLSDQERRQHVVSKDGLLLPESPFLSPQHGVTTAR